MTLPAAQVTSVVTCPAVTGVVPHVGVVVGPPGVPTVLVSCLPAVPAPGNTTICVGPPGVTIKGSVTVLVQNRMTARLTDTAAHGGLITGPGAVTVLVGG